METIYNFDYLFNTLGIFNDIVYYKYVGLAVDEYEYVFYSNVTLYGSGISKEEFNLWIGLNREYSFSFMAGLVEDSIFMLKGRNHPDRMLPLVQINRWFDWYLWCFGERWEPDLGICLNYVRSDLYFQYLSGTYGLLKHFCYRNVYNISITHTNLDYIVNLWDKYYWYNKDWHGAIEHIYSVPNVVSKDFRRDVTYELVLYLNMPTGISGSNMSNIPWLVFAGLLAFSVLYNLCFELIIFSLSSTMSYVGYYFYFFNMLNSIIILYSFWFVILFNFRFVFFKVDYNKYLFIRNIFLWVIYRIIVIVYTLVSMLFTIIWFFFGILKFLIFRYMLQDKNWWWVPIEGYTGERKRRRWFKYLEVWSFEKRSYRYRRLYFYVWFYVIVGYFMRCLYIFLYYIVFYFLSIFRIFVLNLIGLYNYNYIGVIKNILIYGFYCIISNIYHYILYRFYVFFRKTWWFLSNYVIFNPYNRDYTLMYKQPMHRQTQSVEGWDWASLIPFRIPSPKPFIVNILMFFSDGKIKPRLVNFFF